MTYKTINKPTMKLTHFSLSESISHNKASKYFIKVWQFISNTIFSNTEYVYDKDTVNSGIHDNYDITDTTELRLISSRRTFL